MLRKLTSLLLALIVTTAPADDCRKQVIVQRSGVNKVLVPATIGGHTNVLVSVPESVAFSQLAVQVGVPVATYSPLAYQPMPRGPGIHPQQVQATCQCNTCGSCGKPKAADANAVTAQAVDEEAARIARVTETLRQSCVSCHSSAEHKGGLRLFDEAGNLLALPRHTILGRVKSDDPEKRMPKAAEPLTAEQIADIEAWAKLPKEAVW